MTKLWLSTVNCRVMTINFFVVDSDMNVFNTRANIRWLYLSSMTSEGFLLSVLFLTYGTKYFSISMYTFLYALTFRDHIFWKPLSSLRQIPANLLTNKNFWKLNPRWYNHRNHYNPSSAKLFRLVTNSPIKLLLHL